MKDMDTIEEFSGDHFFLSNFFPVDILWDGKSWPTSEHIYQAMKSTDPVEQEKIRLLATPGQAKRAGKKIKCLRADWDIVKFDIMEKIVRAKFIQNPLIKDMLLDTEDTFLEEGNWWGDRIWGISPKGSGIGQNALGEILMKVRDSLRDEMFIWKDERKTS